MKIYLTAREYVAWFAKENASALGFEIDHIKTNTGRTIYFSDMTDDDANFVAQQLMLMSAQQEGNA